MKYTKYILYGSPIKPEELGVMALPAAVIAVPFLSVFLIGAGIMDIKRYLKLKSLLNQRKQRNLRYIYNVIESLDREITDELVSLLITI